MKKEKEICGVKVFVSNEAYNEYKGTLQEQLNEKDEQLDKYKQVIDRIKEYLEEPNRDNFDFCKEKILEMIEELYD